MQDSDEEARILRELTRTENGTDPFSSAVRATRMPMVITDPRQPDNPIVFSNNAFSLLTGYEQAAIVGRNCRFLQGPDTDPVEVARLRQAIDNRTQIEIELVNYKKDGTRFWNRLLVSPVFDAEGEIAYFFASQFDVTLERERLVGLERDRDALLAEVAERNAELLDSEARYRTLFDTIDEGFCVIEFIDGPHGPLSDYVHIQANPAYTANAGIPDIVGKRLREIVGAEADQWAETYRQVLKTGKPLRFERKLEVTGRYLELAAFRLDHPNGRQVAVLFKDVSARRQAEAQLRELNETLEQQVAERTDELRRYHEIVEATESPICAFDTDYRIIAFNKAHNDEFRRVNGFDTKVGDVFFALFAADQQDAMRALMTRALAGERFTVVETFGRPDFGRPSWEISYTPLRDTGGRIVGAFHQARDISSRLLAEAELENTQDALRQSQKMDAMGQLTGGVAHDFNNLLQVVSGNLQLLAKDIAGNDRAERRVANAMAGVSRGSKLAAQLLAFGRRQALEPKVVNVTRFVQGMDDMLRRAIGEGVEVETVFGGGLWNCFIDPAQIENALLNLAINARDAMSGQGKLTIELSNAHLDDEYARTHDEVEPGQYVMLAVSDTGTGMTPDIVDKVFEPFFSTKSEGKGSGLGLSMVYGFVKQSGGHVKIYSEPGHGTTIKLYLPRSMDSEDVEVIVNTGAIEGGTETVLVVEDDDEVRATVVEMLGDLGYRVLKAVDAQSALSVIESGIPIDMLFTDVVMPGTLKSPELARKAKERLPELAVLFTSGYTENSIVHGGRLDAGVELLSKPYTREALARKFRTVLANQRQRSASLAARDLTTAPAPLRSAAGAAGQVTVLLVEDDEVIRATTAEMLQACGYVVVDAASAEDAATALQTVPIDVLVTDVNLPGASGPAFAARARDLRPGVGIVFATGDTAGVPPGTGAVLLAKPYGADALQAAIAAARTGETPVQARKLEREAD